MCALLEFLRDQRPGFVSNQQQYEFSIAAFSEEVKFIISLVGEVTTPAPTILAIAVLLQVPSNGKNPCEL